MAPSRGKGKGKAQPGRRNTRSRTTANDPVPDAYQSLLDEASDMSFEESDRPLKRRKTKPAPRNSTEDVEDVPNPTPDKSEVVMNVGSSASKPTPRRLQTVDDSSDDDDDDSDLDFEDVLVEPEPRSSPDPFDDIQDVDIKLQSEPSTKSTAMSRRKPATFAERSHRLFVHKLHVCCLLGHCMFVNGRCNNRSVQRHLSQLLSSKTLSYLNPKADDTQFQRDRSFMDGLQQAMQIFNAEFRPTGGGLVRPQWSVDGQENRSYDQAPPIDRSEFISAARNLEGSQDTGNQLFCALLRSAGVDARLICSLQVLPFTSVPKASTLKKPVKEYMYALASETNLSKAEPEEPAVGSSKSIGKVPAVRRRLGQPSFDTKPSQSVPARPAKKSKPVPKLTYPVFWVEAFNEAQQKWIPVDVTVTRTINKAAKLEPPASYDLNAMTYVIAFESDGVARDVTKRYAKAYNAKTRRRRVEASTEGAKWMKTAMRIFHRRGGRLDRDQVEDAELAKKEAKEGMPGNVQDFKDHPYYALERHLKRHEVIHPKREVGKVNAGTAAKPKMEPVYRRPDVFVCKSADKWYRVGREIKIGEQPLKHVAARARRQRLIDDKDDEEEAASSTALYAPYQTQLYVPPPVQRGRVPRNAYGNLDVYVPSMVPPGSVHVRHHLAQQAAWLLKVDCADAVTGFKFQGRHGTAIIEGCVVPQQYGDAVWAVVEGFEEQVLEDESKARSLEALRLWKKFLTGLKIRERVNDYSTGITEASQGTEDSREHPGLDLSTPQAEHDKPLITAGCFTLGELTSMNTKSKKRKPARNDSADDDELLSYEADYEHMDIDEGGGGFLPDGHAASPVGDSGGGFFVESSGSGGFVPNNPDKGGGFLQEDESADTHPSTSASDGGGEFIVDDAPDDDLFGEPPTELLNPEQNGQEVDTIEQTGESVIASSGDNFMDATPEATVLTESKKVEQDQTQEPQKGTISTPLDVDLSNRRHDDDEDSILSHDPEDDDAEPDWLESD